MMPLQTPFSRRYNLSYRVRERNFIRRKKGVSGQAHSVRYENRSIFVVN